MSLWLVYMTELLYHDLLLLLLRIHGKKIEELEDDVGFGPSRVCSTPGMRMHVLDIEPPHRQPEPWLRRRAFRSTCTTDIQHVTAWMRPSGEGIEQPSVETSSLAPIR